MCGIVGYVGKNDANSVLLNGLKKYNINKTKIKYIKESIITGNYTYDPDTTYLVFRSYSPKDYHCTFELELSLNNFIDILLSEDNRNKRINFYQI